METKEIQMLQVTADKISTMTGFTPEQVAVVKNTVAKGTTDTELAFFLSVCKQVELNPFLKQVWCFKDKSNNLLIFAGRDGFLAIGQRDSRWNGMTASYVCEKDVFEMDVLEGKVTHKFTADRGRVIGAYCILKPKGVESPTVEWAALSDYCPPNPSSFSPWKNTPAVMIQKVAEVHALKKAFGISGLQSEYDWRESNGTVIPVQGAITAGKVATVDELKQKIEDLLQHCQDDETRTSIVEQIMAADGSGTVEFYQAIINQLEGK